MKDLLTICILLLVILWSCKHPTGQAGNNDSGENGSAVAASNNLVPQTEISLADSASIIETDDYVKLINTIDRNLEREDFRPNVINEKDHSYVLRQEGKVVFALSSVQPGESRERDYFYLKDDQIMFHRHLEWHPEIGLSYAKEKIVFLRNGKVYEVQERQADLAPGLGPNTLFSVDFKRPPVDKEHETQVILKKWENFKAITGVN